MIDTKPPPIGHNCADESAADVANHILADLRVMLRGHKGGQLLADQITSMTIAAIKESAIAQRRYWVGDESP